MTPPLGPCNDRPDLGEFTVKWYYSAGKDPVGPHSADEIAILRQSGQLNAATLVWCKGLADWIALADAEEFAPLLVDAPPPPVPLPRRQATRPETDDRSDLLVDDRPAGDHKAAYRPGEDLDADASQGDRASALGLTAANVAPVLAGPWTRYFARSIDLIIILLLLPTAIYLGLRLTMPPLAAKILALGPQTLLLPLLPLAFLTNAIIITLFGNSLGKAIFAIRAEPTDNTHTRFGWGANLMREFRVWIQGMALGIPLLNFFAMVPAFRAVLRGAPTTYDLGRATVRAYSESRVRRTLGMLFALALYVGVAALGMLDRVMDQRAYQPVAQSVIWTNPTTGLATAIPAGWTYEQVTGPEGTPLHGFSHAKTGLVGFFAVETMPNMDMAGYLRALTQGMSASATLGDWSMSPHPGVWTASGQFTTQGYPTSVYTAQSGNQFWRIMYVDQFSKTPRVIVEPELTEALFRSVGIDVAQ